MPDRGLLERTAIDARPLGGTAPAPWRLEGARWAQLTFEVAQSAALATMPEDTSRPVPCYARLFVLDAPASPAGPFRLAALFTGVRYRMFPRNLLVEAIVEGPANAVEAAFGSPVTPGAITLERDGAQLTATVSAARGPLATLVLPELRAIDAAMLRWDPWLTFANTSEGPALLEVAPRPEGGQAYLTKGATLDTPPSLPRADRWRQFRNLNTISACYMEGDLLLPPPEQQQVIL